jgi:hypothetical protein
MIKLIKQIPRTPAEDMGYNVVLEWDLEWDLLSTSLDTQSYPFP